METFSYVEGVDYVLLGLGAILMLSIKLGIAWWKNDFTTKIFLKKNLLAAFINMQVGNILILGGVDVNYVAWEIDMNIVFWAFVGCSGQWIWRKLSKKLADNVNAEK